jgi:hypothetical protein
MLGLAQMSILWPFSERCVAKNQEVLAAKNGVYENLRQIPA